MVWLNLSNNLALAVAILAGLVVKRYLNGKGIGCERVILPESALDTIAVANRLTGDRERRKQDEGERFRFCVYTGKGYG